MNKGEYAIVGDSDLRDIYVGECIEGNGSMSMMNPVFRVLYMLKYPIQHGIIYTDAAKENPPITPDNPCRLTVIRKASVHDVAMAKAIGYEKSRDDALAAALESAESRVQFSLAHPGNRAARTDPREVEILKRHKQGIVQGARSILVTKTRR